MERLIEVMNTNLNDSGVLAWQSIICFFCHECTNLNGAFDRSNEHKFKRLRRFGMATNYVFLLLCFLKGSAGKHE
jgi:hypothetical protein